MAQAPERTVICGRREGEEGKRGIKEGIANKIYDSFLFLNTLFITL